jgi:dTDP-4-dehydrorhamnose reductase
MAGFLIARHALIKSIEKNIVAMLINDPSFLGLIVGASGFVGRRMREMLGPERSVPTFHSRPIPGGVRFDARSERLADVLRALPRRVSHVFVLYGAIDMEGCARDPVGTARVNVDSVVAMIDDIASFGAIPVYASTDYIFDGTRGGWRENDIAIPVMEYGRQKLAIEQHLRCLDLPWLATRFSKAVSGEKGTHSLLGQWVEDIQAGREMRCAADQVFSPAFVEDVAGVMVKLAAGGHTGLFNLAGPRAYSRLELLRLLVSRIQALRPGVTPRITPISLHDMPFLEKRPLDTSLDTTKLQRAIAHDFVEMTDLCDAIAREHFG